eukprot:gene1492-2874_t
MLSDSVKNPEIKLRSTVLGQTDQMKSKRSSHREHPLENGLYGVNGFYFQQRRGKLDLRLVSNIDLDRVVREVDIDILQLHLENITFCNLREEDLRFITDQHVIKLFRIAQLVIEYLLYVQEHLADSLHALATKYSNQKRSLIKKRKELIELNESSKVMKSQLKSKKKSLFALEELLKETSKSRLHDRRRSDRGGCTTTTDNHSIEEIIPEISRPSILRFYITGPDGVCVEFNNRWETRIADIKREVKLVFSSRNKKSTDKHPSSTSTSTADISLSLYYQGRLLMDDSTLENIGVRMGDTIVAVIHQEDMSNKVIIENNTNSTGTGSTSDGRKDMQIQVEMMERQQEMMKAMISEMRQGWEMSINSIIKAQPQQKPQQDNNSNASNELLMLRMEERWLKMESSMRQQLDSQLGQYEHIMVCPCTNQMQGRRINVGPLEDDNDSQNEEFEKKLRMRRSSCLVDNLKDGLKKQEMEIDELRRRLSTAPTPAQVPAPFSPKPSPKPKTRTTVIIKDYDVIPAPVHTAPVAKVEPSPVKQRRIEETVVVEPEIKIETEPEEEEIEILFPVEHNIELQRRSLDALSVVLYKELDPDDIISELRKSVSESSVSVGADAPEGFSTAMARELAASGRMSAVITEGKPLTDAQLDQLVGQWEDAHSGNDSDNPNSLYDSERALYLRSSRDSSHRYTQTLRASGEGNFFNPIRHSDSPSQSLSQSLSPASERRAELRAAWESVDNVNGLDEDELRLKLATLKRNNTFLVKEVTDHLKSVEFSVTNAMVHAMNAEMSDDTQMYRSSGGLQLLSMTSPRRDSFRSNANNANNNTNTNSSYNNINSRATTTTSTRIGKVDRHEDDDVTAMGSLDVNSQRQRQTQTQTQQTRRESQRRDRDAPTATATSSAASDAASAFREEVNGLAFSPETSRTNRVKGGGRYGSQSASISMSQSVDSLQQTFTQSRDRRLEIDLNKTVDTDISLADRNMDPEDVRDYVVRRERGETEIPTARRGGRERDSRGGVSDAQMASPQRPYVRRVDSHSPGLISSPFEGLQDRDDESLALSDSYDGH